MGLKMDINLLVLESLAVHRNLEDDPDLDTTQANFLLPFRKRNPENKIRAPELAYSIVYSKTSPPLARTDSQQKVWNDMLVDDHIPTEILEQLNSIENIEIRSVCEGHNKDRIAYVIFRTFNQDESYIKSIVNKLRKYPNTYCGYDLGNGGKYRICVATKNWYNKQKSNKVWLEWWMNIPKYIRSSIK